MFFFIFRVAGEDYTQSGRPIDGRRKFTLNPNQNGQGLSPFAAYSFRVAAYNQYGMGEYSEPSPTYNTLPGPPTKAPTNIRGGGGRTGDLTVMWNKLPRQDHNAPGVYYRVYYRRVGVDEERDFQQKTLKALGKLITLSFFKN